MVRIVTGRDARALEEWLFGELSRALEKKEPVLVLVPAQATFLMERQIITRLGLRCV